MSYDRERYWSSVGQRIKERPARRDVAGDDNAFFRHKRRKMLAHFLGTLPVDGRVVMELGCGPGGNLEWLLANRRPARVIGVDISATMLRLAADRLGERATLLKTDGDVLPLPDASVDLAYTVTVLQHNTAEKQLTAIAHELARITRGAIVLMEDTSPQTNSSDSWIGRRVGDYETAMRSVGYGLVSSTYLGMRLSRAGYLRIANRFPSRAEGARAPLLLRALVAMWVNTVAPLDAIVPDHSDVTKMVFERGGRSH
jgi:SAM-dependent methyltransferase